MTLQCEPSFPLAPAGNFRETNLIHPSDKCGLTLYINLLSFTVLLDLSKLPRLISSEQFQSKPETPDKHSEESISEIERQVLSSDDDLTDDTESEQDSDIGEESLVNSFMSMEVIDDPAPVEDSSINVYKEITESKEESPTENIESIYTPKLSSPIKEKSIQKE